MYMYIVKLCRRWISNGEALLSQRKLCDIPNEHVKYLDLQLENDKLFSKNRTEPADKRLRCPALENASLRY